MRVGDYSRSHFACATAIALACLLPLSACGRSTAHVKTPAPQTSMPPDPVAERAALIPKFVVDARVAVPLLGQSVLTATSLKVDPRDIPSSGIAPVFGANVYLLRRPGFAVGFGGEYIRIHATNQPTDATTGRPLGTAIEREFNSASPQLSFNFGHRQGWSYLTVGTGPLTFDTYLAGTTHDGLHPSSLNYGGGARWFSSAHVAFALDLRFYVTEPALPTATVGQRARQKVTVFSAGISIK